MEQAFGMVIVQAHLQLACAHPLITVAPKQFIFFCTLVVPSLLFNAGIDSE